MRFTADSRLFVAVVLLARNPFAVVVGFPPPETKSSDKATPPSSAPLGKESGTTLPEEALLGDGMPNPLNRPLVDSDSLLTPPTGEM